MNIVAFFAHPDDETMLCGGTLALLSKQGHNIYLICATRGEGGECGEPPLCSFDDLGKVREKELLCAAKELGCHEIRFLNFIDPLVGTDNTLYPYTENIQDVVNQLLPLIKQIKPKIILSHGSNGEYGHPAHKVSFQSTLATVKEYNDEIYFYTVQAFFPNHPKPRLANQDDPADIVLDVSSVLEQKIKAALCHKTQHALFVRNASKEAQRKLSVPEVITSIESLHLAWASISILNENDPLMKILYPFLINSHSNSDKI